MKPSPPIRAASLATLVAIWGTTWAVIRIGLGGIPPFTGVALRFGIAGLVLWVAAFAAGLRGPRLRAPWWLWAAQGLFTFGISYGLVYWGEQWVPTGLTAVLFATFPLWVAVLAHLLLPGERMRPVGVLGLLIALGGVALLFSQDLHVLGGPRVAVASGVLLLAPLSSAIAQIVVKRWGSAVHPVTLNAGSMVVASATMGVLAFALERYRSVRFDATSVGSLLYLALLGTCVTFSLYFWLLRHMTATGLSLTAYAIPVVAVIVGAIVFGEAVTPQLLLGGLLVVAGTALAGLRRSAAEH
ncbi:MAG TPA: EamA family transporter [Thermoanaerobaculia bacterium]|jgi:drug/metabolite transporter (DMT)-like permease|nr:EamA family transporter [Thermoanaerobaculia bacterium]